MTPHGKLFDPAESHKLESPDRPTYMPPDELIARLKVASGMTIADVGAGTGFFGIPIARAAAPGKVFAIDLQPEMLDRLRAKLDTPDAPKNIELSQGSTVHTGLRSASCDLVLLANLWHEVEDHAGTLREAGRILKPNGRLAILDWRLGVSQPPGPPLDHRIAMEDVRRAMEGDGWSCELEEPFGAYSYLVVGHLARK